MMITLKGMRPTPRRRKTKTESVAASPVPTPADSTPPMTTPSPKDHHLVRHDGHDCLLIDPNRSDLDRAIMGFYLNFIKRTQFKSGGAIQRALTIQLHRARERDKQGKGEGEQQPLPLFEEPIPADRVVTILKALDSVEDRPGTRINENSRRIDVLERKTTEHPVS